MDRLIATGSVALGAADTAPVSGTPQYATSGVPGVTPATLWPAYQYNAIQEELVGVISGAGITLDRTNNGQLLAAIAAISRGHLSGLVLSNDGVTPNTKLDVSAGTAIDDTNVAPIVLPSGVIDCTTVGANGLDAGSLANTTWYHTFAIAKPKGANPALLASTSVSSPTFPSGYTLKRRLGSFRTDGSAHILPFVQIGDEFLWKAMVLDANAVTPSTANRTLQTLTVPTGVQVRARVRLQIANAAAAQRGLLVTSPDENDQAVTNQANTLNSSISIVLSTPIIVRTNTSAQVGVRADTSTTFTYSMETFGWFDDRGRFA